MTDYSDTTARIIITSSNAVTPSSTNNDEWWILSLVLSSILSACSVYLVTTLSVYEYHVNAKKKQVATTNPSGRKYKPSDWMRWLCLTGSVFILFRAILVLLEIVLGQAYSGFCDGSAKLAEFFYTSATSCTYLTLWLRQRAFYKIPILQTLSNKFVKLLSASVIVLMAISATVTLLIFALSQRYAYTQNGCMLEWAKVPLWLTSALLFFLVLLFQLILLGLLVYPLYKHRASAAASVNKDMGKTLCIIKKVTVATVVSIATTALAALIFKIVLDKRFIHLPTLAFGYDLYVSLLSVIFSFEDWRSRLFAFTLNEKSTSRSTGKSETA